MKYANYLCLDRVELSASGEWAADFPGWCIFQVKTGQGYWLGGSSPQVLNTGAVGALLPLREGGFRASQLAPVTLEYFRFSPDFVSGLLAPSERDSLEALSRQPSYAARFHPATSVVARRFSLTNKESSGGGLQLKAALLGIVADLFAVEMSQPVPMDRVFLSARQRLRLLINEVPEGEFLKMTSREMAARCGNSVKHFNRSFRNLFGMSLAQKQELARLQKARQALVETACRIDTLALDAGYRDAREFSAAFKKHFGVTPSEWRHPKLRKLKPPSGNAA
jgi:AraC-like DNA-binding protein